MYGIQAVRNEWWIGASTYTFIATTKATTPTVAPTIRADMSDNFIGFP